MKTYSFINWLLFFSFPLSSLAQNVGIGTSSPNPSALLQIDAGNDMAKGLLVSGVFSLNGTIPNLGGGSRLMFYPGKGAFRAGTVNSTQWDNSNSGYHSAAMGFNTIAKGFASTAMGNETTAIGNSSTAMGAATNANGSNTLALGYQTDANGTNSLAGGESSVAGGNNSIAFGRTASAPGANSFSFGTETTASGTFSGAFGYKAIANNLYAIALGNETTAGGSNSIAIGFLTSATGNTSTTMGFKTTASGYISTALGYQTTASGEYATTLGNETMASGNNSIAMGLKTTAAGVTATALGWGTNANGASSTAMGVFTIAKAQGATSIGAYNNDEDMPTAFAGSTDRLFQIGNGSSTDVRSNAMTVLRNGNTGIGVLDPAYRLDVAGRMRIRSGGTGSASAGIWLNKNDNSGLTGFVGVDGNNDIGFYTNTSGWSLVVDDATGNVRVKGTVTANGVTLTSDERLKKDITPLQETMPLLEQLNGYQYHWKDETWDKTLQTGLLAQEVEKVLPELVKTDDKGMKSVNYIGLIPYMLEAAKEQQSVITAQQKQIEELKKLVEQLIKK
jgi:hypothetical protein